MTAMQLLLITLIAITHSQITTISQINNQPTQSSTNTNTNSQPTRRTTQSQEIKIFRLQIVEKNKKQIQEHNKNESATFKKGQNEFIQLTRKQFSDTYLTLFPSISQSINIAKKPPKPKTPILNNIGGNVTRSLPGNERQLNLNDPQPLVVPRLPFQDQQEIKVLSYVKNLLKNRENLQEQEIEEEILPKYASDASIVKKEQSDQTTPKIQLNTRTTNGETQTPTQTNTEQQKAQNTNILTTAAPPSSSTPQQISLLTLPSRNLQVNTQFPNLPDVDWSCISGQVRRQGKCGACYAFSPTQTLSAVLAIYYYTFFIQLSPQQILDCPKESLTYGCLGGFLEGSYSYMKKNGISTQYNYPYINQDKARNQQACKKSDVPKSDNFKIKEFIIIQEDNCVHLRQQLQHHPIAVGITGLELFLYRSGVFSDCDKSINHAVLLVGYQEDKGWKIKNTWGTRWGEEGYAWLSKENNCRICKFAQYPVPLLPNKKPFDVRNKKKTCPI